VGERTHPVTGYLTDAEKRQLERWADETGKSQSQLVRDAIMEYTDRDRMSRIEDKLDRTLARLDGNTHTQDPSDTTSGTVPESVPEKAREIADRIYSNHEMPVNRSDLELAVEDIAGGDDRTLEKYKEQLKKRGLLYRHPMQAVWTDDKREWVAWVEGATVNKDIYEITADYRMDTEEYIELAEEQETVIEDNP